MATHSKTRRAVQRLRRLARRRREAELKKARRGGTDHPSPPPPSLALQPHSGGLASTALVEPAGGVQACDIIRRVAAPAIPVLPRRAAGSGCTYRAVGGDGSACRA